MHMHMQGWRAREPEESSPARCLRSAASPCCAFRYCLRSWILIHTGLYSAYSFYFRGVALSLGEQSFYRLYSVRIQGAAARSVQRAPLSPLLRASRRLH
jgi:hypothetical protein